MPLDQRKVVKALLKKGFQDGDEGRDHDWYRLYVDGKKSEIATKVSRGSTKYRDLGDNLVSAMASQVKLTRQQFRDFVQCDISEEDYLKILREKGFEF